MSDRHPDSRAVTPLISGEEREAVVRRLTAAFAEDAIPVDEFERRVSQVYRAEHRHALESLTRDLPKPPREGGLTPAPIQERAVVARRPRQRFASVLGSMERGIHGPMPECLEVRSVMGSIELDLRGAQFPPGVTELRLRAVMGNIEIELPDHVHVENEGHALLGNFSVSGRPRSRQGEATPVVRITGRSIMGNVEIELDD